MNYTPQKLQTMNHSNTSVQIALKNWNQQVERATRYVETATDELLMKEVSPGKNRGIYLLGHLVAVNDSMLAVIGGKERAYTHLDEAFIKNPDKSQPNLPSITELKAGWQKTISALGDYFSALSTDDWFARHHAMTDEDFEKDPTRNRLSVLMSRTAHMAYHLGQLNLVK